ncbi:hypothetical protein EON62_05780, partial [archaeon]
MVMTPLSTRVSTRCACAACAHTRIPHLLSHPWGRVRAGRNLPAADADGGIDPYLKISLAGATKQISPRFCTRNPCWYETVTMNVLLPALPFAPMVCSPRLPPHARPARRPAGSLAPTCECARDALAAEHAPAVAPAMKPSPPTLLYPLR